MPRLSIIVPVYNVEKYLPKCIDSILAQTFTDFECILVDDGSPDNCAGIIDEYAQKDSRIKVIHQENRGLSAARNAGLRIATGGFIGFVDSDDWIAPEMYSEMLQVADREEADVVCCNLYTVNEIGEKKARKIESVPHRMSRREFLIHVCDIPSTIDGYVCNKLWKKDNISFFDETLTMCEDLAFVVENSKYSDKYIYISRPFYYYLQRRDSITGNLKKFSEALPMRRRMIDLIHNEGKEVVDAFERKYLDACCLCCECTKGRRNANYFLTRKELKSYLQNNRKHFLKNKCISIKEKIVILYWYIRSKFTIGEHNARK